MITLLLQSLPTAKSGTKSELLSPLLDFKSLLFSAGNAQLGEAASSELPTHTTDATTDNATLTLETSGIETLSELFNPEHLQGKSAQDIHLLIARAKSQLKHAINQKLHTQSSDATLSEKQSAKTTTPTTLRALMEKAIALDIDLQSITLSKHDGSDANALTQQSTKTFEEPLRNVALFNPKLSSEALLQFAQKQAQPLLQTPTPQRVHSRLASEHTALSQALHAELDSPLALQSVHKQDLPTQTAPTPALAPLSLLLNSSAKEEQSSVVDIKSELPNTTLHTQTSTIKLDTLEIKTAEAKQGIANFAQQLANEVENYKPPFTRIKMALQPAKLGEVDVTMIQRGNSLHITVQSNVNAITLFAQHATELKTQLAAHGISDSTMQFNANFNQQQQQRQQQQHQPNWPFDSELTDDQPFFEISYPHAITYA